jgi:hypothetical protein
VIDHVPERVVSGFVQVEVIEEELGYFVAGPA